MTSCQIQNKTRTTNPRTHLDEKMSQSPIGKALKRKHNKKSKNSLIKTLQVLQ